MDRDAQTDEILKALANPLRRQILHWLRDPETYFGGMQTHPLSEGVCVSKICDKAGVSQSTISAYLAILQRSGLVTSHRIGGWTLYKRNEEMITKFLRCLGDNL